jgi:site-specific recombinase XerD
MTSTELVPVDDIFSHGERMALLGFLAAYQGATREAYASDLRQFSNWCTAHHLGLFEAHRVDIECFARDLEARGRARATMARRLCTITGFYRYAGEEGLIDHSPAVHVRRPRLDYESHATGLDRNELGAILVAAGLAGARDHALLSMLALNGLRISEALGADVDALGLERGHRTLTVCRKGGKIVTMPLAPRVARAVDLAIGERGSGPIFRGPDGQRLERHAAARIVRRIARRAGIDKRVGPHTLRHAFITAALDAGVPLRDVQEAASHADPPTTMRYDRGRQSLDRHATYIVATFVAGAGRLTEIDAGRDISARLAPEHRFCRHPLHALDREVASRLGAAMRDAPKRQLASKADLVAASRAASCRLAARGDPLAGQVSRARG